MHRVGGIDFDNPGDRLRLNDHYSLDRIRRYVNVARSTVAAPSMYYAPFEKQLKKMQIIMTGANLEERTDSFLF